ncbi:hypothetical protein CKY10_08210 [Photorhabdus sp. HUG-39]|nr:hypothetical protein CKY10_08210 [Photorhabdus sp. HUG-39]
MKYSEFEQDILTHNSIVHVVSCISVKQSQKCFIEWINIFRELMKSLGGTTDGKTVRRSQFSAVTQGNCYLG